MTATANDDVDLDLYVDGVDADFDWESRLLDINTRGITIPQYRIDACRYDPLLFALVYLRRHLKSEETDERVSLNQFHIDICDAAIRWALCDRRPGRKEFRECWIAPRGCGKSTWMFLIIPIWAAAYGHKKYIAMFADSGKQAKQHLDSILQEFRTNARLRNDFPLLCKSREAKGGDTANEYRSVSFVTFTAYGVDASTLGAKAENKRPDFIILDDIEPPGEKFSGEQKHKRQNTIVNAIFAMNPNAVVWIAGTTVAYDSIIHDIVRETLGVLDDDKAAWTRREKIVGRYYPAIVTDERGNERSLWPERWSLEELVEERLFADFQLNYMNNPTGGEVDSETGEVTPEFWEEGDFGDYTVPWEPTEACLVFDPATTSKERSDQTGVGIISVAPSGLEVCVEYANGVRYRPEELREFMLEILEDNPIISTIIVETNQGGDYILNALQPIPRGYKVIEKHEESLKGGANSKKARVRKFFTYDDRGYVRYRKKFGKLQSQQITFPNGMHDDIVDAVAKGVHYWLQNHPAMKRRR